MIKKVYKFACEDCSTKGEYADKDQARAMGWAIARGDKICYCPACAFRHRNTGKRGAQVPGSAQLNIELGAAQ